MAILYHPRPGEILICHFEPGFTAPEMVKARPVIVVTPRLRRRDGLCTVVPLSSTPPDLVEPYHHLLRLDRPLPKPFEANPCWVKADMLYTVGFHRLHLIGAGRNSEGRRKYLQIRIGDDELRKIQACILHGLNLSSLTPHL